VKQIELLSPAGNLEKLKVALLYGADAVYGGVSHFSLRLRSGKDFDYESFKEGIEYAHSINKKVYVTINGFPFSSQLKLLKNHIAKMRDLSPDAFIISTPGVIKLCKQIAPDIPLHLSTQANVLNYLDALVYYELGVSRIIAAREASLKDLEDIKNHVPQLEIEMFVHGAMCFAYSGRCLLTSLQTGRVANRGSCANDCRFPYEVYIKSPETGVLMRVEEDENGSYIFNAKDLNLVKYIKDIVDSGVIDSIKIEGRTKSSYYAGITTRAYKMALNDAYKNQFNPSLYEEELQTTKNRGFSEGYIFNRPFEKDDDQNLQTSLTQGTKDVLAIVDESGEFFLARGKITKDTTAQIVLPLDIELQEIENEYGKIFKKDNQTFITFKKLEKKDGSNLDSIHSGNINPIKLPTKLLPYLLIRSI
jgi:putative protease